MPTCPLVAPYSAYKISPFWTNLAEEFSSPCFVKNNSVLELLISAERMKGMLPP